MTALHITVTATQPPKWINGPSGLAAFIGPTGAGCTYEASARVPDAFYHGRDHTVTATSADLADALRQVIDQAAYHLGQHPNRVTDITMSMQRRIVEPGAHPTGTLDPQADLNHWSGAKPSFYWLDDETSSDDDADEDDHVVTPEDYLK